MFLCRQSSRRDAKTCIQTVAETQHRKKSAAVTVVIAAEDGGAEIVRVGKRSRSTRSATQSHEAMQAADGEGEGRISGERGARRQRIGGADVPILLEKWSLGAVEEALECCACMDRVAHTALLPCGHMFCMEEGCSSKTRRKCCKCG